MAPSVQQLPEDIPVPSIEKLAITKEAPVEAVKEVEAPKAEEPKEAVKDGPKVKRQIEIEGGKTDAKVIPLSNPIFELSNDLIVPTIPPNVEPRPEIPPFGAIYPR